MENFRRFETPREDRGATVQPTSGIAQGSPSVEQSATNRAPTVSGLGHTDHGQHIQWRPELRGWAETMTHATGGTLSTDKFNVFVASGAFSVPAPPAVPSAQVPDGAKIRQRGQRIFVALTGAATWPSNVKFGRWLDISTPSAPEWKTTAPDFVGPTDVYMLVWFESFGTWFASPVAIGATPVHSDTGEDTKPTTDPEDPGDEPFIPADRPAGEHSRTYAPEDIARPTNIPSGSRLFLLGSASTIAITANGGYSFSFGVHPSINPLRANGVDGRGEVAILDAFGVDSTTTTGLSWEIKSVLSLLGLSARMSGLARSATDVLAVGAAGAVMLKRDGSWHGHQFGTASYVSAAAFKTLADSNWFKVDTTKSPFGVGMALQGGDLTSTSANMDLIDGANGTYDDLDAFLSVKFTADTGIVPGEGGSGYDFSATTGTSPAILLSMSPFGNWVAVPDPLGVKGQVLAGGWAPAEGYASFEVPFAVPENVQADPSRYKIRVKSTVMTMPDAEYRDGMKLFIHGAGTDVFVLGTSIHDSYGTTNGAWAELSGDYQPVSGDTTIHMGVNVQLSHFATPSTPMADWNAVLGTSNNNGYFIDCFVKQIIFQIIDTGSTGGETDTTLPATYELTLRFAPESDTSGSSWVAGKADAVFRATGSCNVVADLTKKTFTPTAPISTSLAWHESETGRISTPLAGVSDATFAVSIPAREFEQLETPTTGVWTCGWSSPKNGDILTLLEQDTGDQWIVFDDAGVSLPIAYTTDGGWTQGTAGSHGLALADVKAGGGILLASSETVVKKSTNGTTWTTCTPAGMTGRTHFIYVPARRAWIGIEHATGRIFRSYDNGATWSSTLPALLSGASAYGWIACCGTRTFTGLVGTADLFWSDDFGTTWKVTPPVSNLVEVDGTNV